MNTDLASFLFLSLVDLKLIMMSPTCSQRSCRDQRCWNRNGQGVASEGSPTPIARGLGSSIRVDDVYGVLCMLNTLIHLVLALG